MAPLKVFLVDQPRIEFIAVHFPFCFPKDFVQNLVKKLLNTAWKRVLQENFHWLRVSKYAKFGTDYLNSQIFRGFSGEQDEGTPLLTALYFLRMTLDGCKNTKTLQILVNTSYRKNSRKKIQKNTLNKWL